eukprot:scaffold70075_cov18-Tisochrysis_lutea.AAC.1
MARFRSSMASRQAGVCDSAATSTPGSRSPITLYRLLSIATTQHQQPSPRSKTRVSRLAARTRHYENWL